MGHLLCHMCKHLEQNSSNDLLSLEEAAADGRHSGHIQYRLAIFVFVVLIKMIIYHDSNIKGGLI